MNRKDAADKNLINFNNIVFTNYNKLKKEGSHYDAQKIL